MSATSRRTRIAVVAALVLAALGVTGYAMAGRASRDPRPDSVGFGVAWSHELHARHPAFNCQSCHHESAPGSTRMEACDGPGCHARGPAHDEGLRWSDEAPPARTALHAKCVGCHNAVEQGPTECAGCHEGNRGTARCGSCHSDTLAAYSKAGHAAVPCSACHTKLSGDDVAETGTHRGHVPSAGDRESCLGCHGQERDLAGFPERPFEVTGSHAELPDPASSNCQDCHAPHSPAAG